MQIILIAIAVWGLAMPTGLAARLEAGSNQQDKSAVHAPRPPSNWWKTERYIQELRLTPEQSARSTRSSRRRSPGSRPTRKISTARRATSAL